MKIAIRHGHDGKARGGFTLIELLCVVAVISVLAVELLAAKPANQQAGQIARCINNHRQLTLAWKMYADENNGVLVPNTSTVAPGTASWAMGVLSWDLPPSPPNPDNTNLLDLSGALLGPYCNRTTAIYKCPGDNLPGVRGARVRSMSLNGMMNGISTQSSVLNQTPVPYRLFVNENQLVNPLPSAAWVFTDEHADSIDDGFFRVDMSQTNSWANLPASYHDDQGMYSYADGHVEPRRWTDVSIAGRPVSRVAYTTFSASASTATDLVWLQMHTTSLAGN